MTYIDIRFVARMPVFVISGTKSKRLYVLRRDKHDSRENNECNSRLRRRATVRKSQIAVMEFASQCVATAPPPHPHISRIDRYYVPLAIDESTISRRSRSRNYAPHIFDSATYRMLRSRSDQEYPTSNGIMS